MKRLASFGAALAMALAALPAPASARALLVAPTREQVCIPLLAAPPRPRTSTVVRALLPDLPLALRLAFVRRREPPSVLCTAFDDTPSYVEAHTARVMRSFFYFAPALATREDQLENDVLPMLRERDRLLLFRQPGGSASDGAGVPLFAATVFLAAHAPEPVRAVFDGRLHLGPAVFDGGGMGTAVGLRW